jgi:hypothetical protein
MGEDTKVSIADQQSKGIKGARPPSRLASDDAEVKVPKRFYRRRSCQLCCGITTAVILAILIIILVLSFTVFKAKDPVITVTGVSLKSFSFSTDPSLTTFKLDVALHLNVSVHNPNVASFKYKNSSTYLSYRGREVGSAPIPAGSVGAKKTVKLQTDLDIQALQIVMTANLTSDLQAGVIPISTHAAIAGKLNIVNIFKHHAISTSDCNANIMVANQTLGAFDCDYHIKL